MTSAGRATTPLLFAEHVHKRYGGVHALRDVHLDVAQSEIHALVGENGAGKSTMINILAGAVRRDEGRVTFDGRVVDFASPAESQAAGIAVIHQELATLPTMSVAENVCMGRMPTKGWRIDRPAMYSTTRELLHVVGLDVEPDARMSDLSLSHQQLVEIAKALGAGARLLVMDEPTASLTEHEALHLHSLARQLRDRGTAILFVSHRLSEVFAISDRITVFRDGAHVATLSTAVTTPEQIVGLMVGRAMSLEAMVSVPDPDAAVVLEVRGLTRRNPSGPSLEQVNLAVRRGEIVGLAGLVGAGRSELARAIFGEDSYDTGEILLEGSRCVFDRRRTHCVPVWRWFQRIGRRSRCFSSSQFARTCRWRCCHACARAVSFRVAPNACWPTTMSVDFVSRRPTSKRRCARCRAAISRRRYSRAGSPRNRRC
jgi:ABC-type sugar transport system ATPase subunit